MLAAMLGYTRIEAPFDGVVIRRNVNTGDLPRPGPGGPPLFVVARSDILTIAVNVPETFATDVNPGDRASVTLQAMKGRVVEGKVSRISSALDPKTRTIRVEIDMPNPGVHRLGPGLYAYATIIAEEHPDVLTIPATAIVEEDGKALSGESGRRQGRPPPDRDRPQPRRLRATRPSRACLGTRPWSRPTPPRSPTARPSRSSRRPGSFGRGRKTLKSAPRVRTLAFEVEATYEGGVLGTR